ncbi:hypothetical protein HPB48_005258 [Haemaphysalis longicornis]|uniref:[phosphatase 2A protein]-leucine-carboxy methyltransferase n=1 Tax=Haemaphysalis longicornis TaxID=44386 RepID=A0A9J6FMA8_HAELO|nr:hypothetical protein HPB48_005258 [Haemaphysalis longicornis]
MPKNSKHRSVQSTNDSSILSKCSMVLKGYMTDGFTTSFATKCARRSPLINRGYYVRAKCMSMLFEDYCRFFKDSACQVLSLGAGYDANFFKLKATGALPAGCRYFEVDLPLVVTNKSQVIKSSAELSSLASGPSTSGCCEQYRLFSQDICDLHGLESALQDAGLDFHTPTLIIAECVLSYLDTKHSDALIEWTSSAIHARSARRLRASGATRRFRNRHVEALRIPRFASEVPSQVPRLAFDQKKIPDPRVRSVRLRRHDGLREPPRRRRNAALSDHRAVRRVRRVARKSAPTTRSLWPEKEASSRPSRQNSPPSPTSQQFSEGELPNLQKLTGPCMAETYVCTGSVIRRC